MQQLLVTVTFYPITVKVGGTNSLFPFIQSKRHSRYVLYLLPTYIVIYMYSVS